MPAAPGCFFRRPSERMSRLASSPFPTRIITPGVGGIIVMECARSRVKPWPTFTASFSSGRAKPKAESRKQKSEMNQGRLPEEFRDRTKRFASSTVRLFIALPKDREEVRTLGKQLLRSGTSVAAHTRGAWRTHSDEEFASKNFQRSHLARLCGREPFYRSQFQFSSTVERGWKSCRVARSLVPPPGKNREFPGRQVHAVG